MCPAVRAADYNPARSTSALLVDLARDHGLNCRGRQTPADLLRISTLLKAAARLDQSNARAYVWLYELALRGDRPDEAAEMLARIVSADPDNASAFANWLVTGPPDVQTVEQRRDWLTRLLGEHQHPERQALIHTHLAVATWQQTDREAACLHLETARLLWPDCPEAALAALEPTDPDAPIEQRLAVLLHALALNPLDVELSWQVGLLLHTNGFAAEAQPFYEYALSVHEKLTPNEPPASSRLLDLTRCALARGDRAAADEYALRAAGAERGTYEARFLLFWLFENRPAPPLLEQLQASLPANFAEIKAPADWPAELVAEAAWYYCIIDQQPQRALMLAENAAERAAGATFATRVLGWAQALNNRNEDARGTLASIAKIDAYAAYRLGSLMLEAGERDAAASVIRELSFIPQAGRARVLLDALETPLPTSLPARTRFPEVLQTLDNFDRTVFDLHKHLERYLKAEVKLADSSFLPGDPWRVIFSLTNTGSFPITLGPDWMVNPVFLLSFHVEGDRTRDYPNLMTVSLDRERIIMPGECVQSVRTIDIGPLRKTARRAPQQLQSITMSAILDPQKAPQGWRAAPTGLTLRPAAFVRLPANTDPEAWRVRFAQLKNKSLLARYHALETIAELLGESQRAATKRLTYRPRSIPADRARQALLAALRDESWEMRVRALEALQAAGLDQTLLAAARDCLDHPHWAVRLTAVRLLARQGEAFAETAKRLAEQDPDDLVRALARSYIKE